MRLALSPLAFVVVTLTMTVAASCAPPPSITVGNARVDFDPLRVVVDDDAGSHTLTIVGLHEASDLYFEEPQLLPGWDGYREHIDQWRLAKPTDLRADVDAHGNASALVTFAGDVEGTLRVTPDADGRVRLHVDVKPSVAGTPPKTSVEFVVDDGEAFFGMGERYASSNHRGLGLYSWAEEGGLGGGEDPKAAQGSPFPNGASMTYFPVPFFLSSNGYALHVDTTARSEVHFADEEPHYGRIAVSAAAFDLVVYPKKPLDALALYTADTGRPPIPAPWVWGPRRRVDVDNDDELHRLRDNFVPTTGIDDALHFLPHLSQVGREADVKAWTGRVHDLGFKVMAYNNPYVSMSDPTAAADFTFGKAHDFFLKDGDGNPGSTFFISGEPQTIATIDLSNDDAVTWFQSLLQRTLDFGYDGWMHDFGEYVQRDWHAHNGETGEFFHNRFPVLSAKAAHDFLERVRPDDYLFFVRSGGSGTQHYVPAVWGGDAEATFDETQGIPSALRSGLNLGMSGVPYWGSDGTGFKCLTNYPRDKEVYLRWAELMAVSPIMMEQNACSNPVNPGQTKWSLWNDQETIDTYGAMVRLHTRLQPYFEVLAQEAHDTGAPLMRHPFLTNPDDAMTHDIDDEFFLGASLFVAPVVRRHETAKNVWLPAGRYVDFDDGTLYDARDVVHQVTSIPAPLDKLPLLLVENQLVPLLDRSVTTLAEIPSAPASATIVSPSMVADRLDVVAAIGRDGSAHMHLTDGTDLSIEPAKAPNDTLVDAADNVDSCARCVVRDRFGDVARVRANGALAADDSIVVDGMRLSAIGQPHARRVRWTILRLP